MNESFESAEHLAAVAIAEQQVRITKARPFNPFESWPAADPRIKCTACGRPGQCRIRAAGIDKRMKRGRMVLQQLVCGACHYEFANTVAMETSSARPRR